MALFGPFFLSQSKIFLKNIETKGDQSQSPCPI